MWLSGHECIETRDDKGGLAMAVSRRPSGVRVEYPPTYRIGQPTEPGATTRRIRRRAGEPLLASSPTEVAAEHDALVAAFTSQAMTHVDTIPLQPTRAATASTGRRPRDSAAFPSLLPITLSVDLESAENAAVLVAQDGVYSWVLPDRTPRSGASTRRARGPAAGSAGRTVQFTIGIRAQTKASTLHPTRGIVSYLVYGAMRAIVLKFVAPRLLGNTVALLEQHITEGIVVMDQDDPGTWRPLGPATRLALPKGRSPRLLLFVHGTFSSTVGQRGTGGRVR